VSLFDVIFLSFIWQLLIVAKSPSQLRPIEIMNTCRIIGIKCPVKGKMYGAALLAATLLAISPERLSATGGASGSGTEANPWIFNSTNYPLYFSSVQYSVYLGYFFNDSDGYYETGSSVDVSGQTYPSIYVGYSHTIGKLTIDDGYTVKDVTGYIGYLSGSGGTVLVTGSGSTWTNTGNLYIGYQGTGELDVASGGAVTASTIYIGGIGTDNTTGTGVGTLNITGGTVSSAKCFVGCQSGTSGAITVNGSSAAFTTTNQLIIGAVCKGSLTVEAGGTVTSAAAILGNNSGVTGTALVTGSGSTWNGAGGITVGYTGNGILNIEAAGAVTTPVMYVGYYDGASGTVTVTGEDSKLTVSSVLCVGMAGTGILNIKDGGRVAVNGTDTNYDCYIGGFYYTSDTTGDGTINVTGSGSTLTCKNYLYVGYNGKGTLNVESGGAVSAGTCYVGFVSGSSGKVTVTGSANGTASTLTVGGGIVLGNAGTGELNVLNGGHVISGYTTYIGYTNTGTVLVSGSGSELLVDGSLKVGQDNDYGTGTLTIEAGGLVTATGFSLLSGKGKLYIGGGYLAISGSSLVSTISTYVTAGSIYAWNGTEYVQVCDSDADTTNDSSALLDYDYYTYSSDTSSVAYALYTELDLDESLSYTILTSVPEPSTWALLGGIGALGMAFFARRRRA
jgi:T5SS/PEP-CTERM-associated repeat protein